MNIGALFLIFFGFFLLLILFFVESGSSNNLSNPTPTLLFTDSTDSNTFSGGNPCLVFTEIFLTIIVITLLVIGAVMLIKSEKPNVEQS